MILDYYYNDDFDFLEVITGGIEFIACFIMRVNDKPVLNDYDKYPDFKEYANKDWITWLGTQFMQSLITFENDSTAYSYIHFLEYARGKGLEIYLKDSETISISYIEGLKWYSFGPKLEGISYSWKNEVVSLAEYRSAIERYCTKIYNEYASFSQPIYDHQFVDFNEYYTKLFKKV